MRILLVFPTAFSVCALVLFSTTTAATYYTPQSEGYTIIEEIPADSIEEPTPLDKTEEQKKESIPIPKSTNTYQQEPSRVIPRKAIPQTPIPRKAIPQKRIPTNPIPRKAVPRKEIPHVQIPRKQIPRKAVPRNKVPQNRIPSNRIPSNRIPSNRL